MNKLPHKLHKAIKQKIQSVRKSDTESQTDGDVPRITNETVAEHREEVLSSARKYIYPLQHSRHRIVIISISIFVAVVVAFFAYSLLALYRFHTTSTFMYRVTQIIPFPIARAGSSFVAYENYLFELRRYTHYYSSQQNIDFGSESGKQQLEDFKKRALSSVVDDAIVKKLAKEQNVTVSRGEIDSQIKLLRSQNRLGSSDQVFEDVLREFWGWSIDDFRRELRSQLLAQKVVAKLDTDSQQKSAEILQKIAAGEDFAALAKQFSDDAATGPNGGDFGFEIERSNRDLDPRVIDTLFGLQIGQTSGSVQTATGLEIVKVLENNAGKLRAAHIFCRFEPIETYLQPIKDKNEPVLFISL